MASFLQKALNANLYIKEAYKVDDTNLPETTFKNIEDAKETENEVKETGKEDDSNLSETIVKDFEVVKKSADSKEIHYEVKETDNAEKINEKENIDIECEILKQSNEIYKISNFKLSDVTEKAVKCSHSIIFIGSTGIAVRAISPFIKTKDIDPGVVVVDLANKYSISLLSGHLGGGNELALKVSKILNNIPIITTATDNLGIVAPDIVAKDNDLIIEDLKKAKYIASILVDGKTVGIKDDYNKIEISKGYEKVEELREDCIWITHDLKYDKEYKSDYSNILKLIKKDLVLGIGCRRSTPYKKLKQFINESLEKYNLDIRAVNKIVSVDVKKDEEGLIKLAETLNCPFKTFERKDIQTVQDKYEKSEFVLKTLGITGVCEPCVDLAGAKVIISKIKHEGMTLAIGVLKNTLT
ncbi:cobalt-precorrin 5A hydrolase [Clostridium uliginosum]